MTDQELAQAYAPVLLFSKGEQFFPMEAEKYIERCSLHIRENDTGEKMLIPPGCVTLHWIDNARYSTRDLFLTYADRRGTSRLFQGALTELWHLRRAVAAAAEAAAEAIPAPAPAGVLGSLRERIGDLIDDAGEIVEDLTDRLADELDDLEAYQDLLRLLKRSVGGQVYSDHVYQRARRQYLESQSKLMYYYRVLPGSDPYNRIVQYWYFYAFNPHINRHEADWESVTLYFRDDRPDRAFYSAHKGGNNYARKVITWIDDAATGCEHPLVYVAKDSHAHYASAARVRTESGLAKTRKGKRLPCDEFEPGGLIVGPLTEQDFEDGPLAGHPFKALQPWDEPEALQNQDWLNFDGLWGVCVRHSRGRLPDEDDLADTLEEQVDEVLAAWVDRIIGKKNLADLMGRLGSAPVGPRQHNQHTEWDNPVRLLDRR